MNGQISKKIDTNRDNKKIKRTEIFGTENLPPHTTSSMYYKNTR